MKLHQALPNAVAVRVVEGFSSESVPGVTMFGLTMDEGAAVLGEAQVFGDGSWLARVPARIPIHLRLRWPSFRKHPAMVPAPIRLRRPTHRRITRVPVRRRAIAA